jgi:hypothetical protein
MKKQILIVYSGYAVLVAILLILLSTALLRGGHPPGFGIVNLLLIVLVYPISIFGAISALKTSVKDVHISIKLYFLMAGACLTFSFFTTIFIVLKFIFGKAM